MTATTGRGAIIHSRLSIAKARMKGGLTAEHRAIHSKLGKGDKCPMCGNVILTPKGGEPVSTSKSSDPFAILEKFNPNHSKQTGKFSTGSGKGGGGGSGGSGGTHPARAMADALKGEGHTPVGMAGEDILVTRKGANTYHTHSVSAGREVGLPKKKVGPALRKYESSLSPIPGKSGQSVRPTTRKQPPSNARDAQYAARRREGLTHREALAPAKDRLAARNKAAARKPSTITPAHESDMRGKLQYANSFDNYRQKRKKGMTHKEALASAQQYEARQVKAYNKKYPKGIYNPD